MSGLTALLNLCQNIAGITIFELANMVNITCPISLHHNKGWIGQLLEIYLGAKSSNLPIPDFPALGVELKTIPVNIKTLIPKESTYICTAPLNNLNLNWSTSVVYQKLSKILWIPIEYSPNMQLSQRKIGKAFLWQPNNQQNIILQNDWYALTEMLMLGKLQLLSAKYGNYLQLRPKAANCTKNLITYKTIDGELIKTVARGFYLRSSFTGKILTQNFRI